KRGHFAEGGRFAARKQFSGGGTLITPPLPQITNPPLIPPNKNSSSPPDGKGRYANYLCPIRPLSPPPK
ncbi:hypothetical protein T492DRAFT_916451, partial [Pavlovales sp. CCMP2436]